MNIAVRIKECYVGKQLSQNLIFVFLFMALTVNLYCAEQTKTAFDINQLSNQEISSRLDFIQIRLNASEHNIRLWNYGWIAFNGALGVLNAVSYFGAEQDLKRVEYGYNGLISLGTVGYMIINPLFSSRNTVSKLASYPYSTREEKIKRLEEAEKLLSENATAEAQGRAWVSHALGVCIGTAVGLSLWKNYNGKDEGISNFISLVAGNELMIFTQPTRAIRDWREYNSTFNSNSSPKNRSIKDKYSWYVFLSANRAGIFVTF